MIKANPFLDKEFQIEEQIPYFEYEFIAFNPRLSAELYKEYFVLFHPDVRVNMFKTATNTYLVILFRVTPKMLKWGLDYMHSNLEMRS